MAASAASASRIAIARLNRCSECCRSDRSLRSLRPARDLPQQGHRSSAAPQPHRYSHTGCPEPAPVRACMLPLLRRSGPAVSGTIPTRLAAPGRADRHFHALEFRRTARASPGGDGRRPALPSASRRSAGSLRRWRILPEPRRSPAAPSSGRTPSPHALPASPAATPARARVRARAINRLRSGRRHTSKGWLSAASVSHGQRNSGSAAIAAS